MVKKPILFYSKKALRKINVRKLKDWSKLSRVLPKIISNLSPCSCTKFDINISQQQKI